MLDCFSELIGDGFCDDEVNNFFCLFDGGDCCGDEVNDVTCLQCMCLVATTTTTTFSTTTTSTTEFDYDLYYCPDNLCLNNDTVIVAKKIDFAPFGNFENHVFF